MANVLEAIQQRYACRRFVAGGPPSDDELVSLIEAGRLAPSAFGLEPWRFLTVVDAAQRAELARACFGQPAAATAPAFIAVVALVDALDPESDYVRARFEAEARGGPIAPLYEMYRAFYRAEATAAWAQGQCHFAAALGRALHLPTGESPALVIALGHCADPMPERVRKPPVD